MLSPVPLSLPRYFRTSTPFVFLPERHVVSQVCRLKETLAKLTQRYYMNGEIDSASDWNKHVWEPVSLN